MEASFSSYKKTGSCETGWRVFAGHTTSTLNPQPSAQPPNPAPTPFTLDPKTPSFLRPIVNCTHKEGHEGDLFNVAAVADPLMLRLAIPQGPTVKVGPTSRKGKPL